MKWLGLLLFVFYGFDCRAQSVTISGADTADERIRVATRFLVRYLSSFEGRRVPDFARYWSWQDYSRSALPDDMVYSIADDYPAYWMGGRAPAIFYARAYDNYVHLKSLVVSLDSNGTIEPWAITNHYVQIEPSSRLPRFISELELHAADYREERNRNIIYHFPAGDSFNRQTSNHMLTRLEAIEQQWGFSPMEIHYYYASNEEQLARMRGMDYKFAMDGPEPSGMSYPRYQKLFCQGLGEGYLHEVLHMYFHPLYEKSPMCHAMVYYLAGGVGKDFDWFINRMNEYLQQYPDTDLSKYESLHTKDKMLHIDYVVKGLLCKMIDEKDGVAGLKRALSYSSADALLLQEFGISQKESNAFLRKSFMRYGRANAHLSTGN